MKLLNEMAEQLELDVLIAEMDEVIEQYQKLIQYTSLYEGTVLDNLPSDDLIEKITEIERRMQVIKKARSLVDKLSKSGWDKKKVRMHKSRLYQNKERLRKSMFSAKRKLAELESAVDELVSDITPEDKLAYSES